jgi:hypothetical protein
MIDSGNIFRFGISLKLETASETLRDNFIHIDAALAETADGNSDLGKSSRRGYCC